MRIGSLLIAFVSLVLLWKGGEYLGVSIFETAKGNPVEVGNVQWMRDHDEALKLSKESGKPVFALFQEVPGCAGCRQFGKDVLRVPALVNSIQEEFVPLLIYNNKAIDKHLLKRYGEPSWNFQVIRFLDSNGEDIIPRKDRVWDLQPLAQRMKKSLEKFNLPVSNDLKVLASGSIPEPQYKEAAFAMFCFWTGEMKLGQIDGVINTEAGWLDGHEVTRVKYEPGVISLDKLIKKAERIDCARKVFLPEEDLSTVSTDSHLKFGALDKSYRIAKKSDQKRQLQGTQFANMKLTPFQATKVNAWIRVDPKRATAYLK